MPEISEEAKFNISWFAVIVAMLAIFVWLNRRKQSAPVALTGTPANPTQPAVTTPLSPNVTAQFSGVDTAPPDTVDE